MQMYRNIPKEQLSNTLYSKIFRVNGQKKVPEPSRYRGLFLRNALPLGLEPRTP